VPTVEPGGSQCRFKAVKPLIRHDSTALHLESRGHVRLADNRPGFHRAPDAMMLDHDGTAALECPRVYKSKPRACEPVTENLRPAGRPARANDFDVVAGQLQQTINVLKVGGLNPRTRNSQGCGAHLKFSADRCSMTPLRPGRYHDRALDISPRSPRHM